MTKKKKTKTASAAPMTGAAIGRIVLVGTYKGDQLEKWPGWYCWPLDKEKPAAENARSVKKFHAKSAKSAKGNTDSSETQRKNLSAVSELWLFQGTKAQRTYNAEFVGVKTREELVRDYGYPAKGKAHGTNYALFKTELLYGPGGDNPEEADAVIIRTKDFATSPKVRKQLKEYLESPDRKNPSLAKLLPSVITFLPPERLRVCEAMLQLDFDFFLGTPFVPNPALGAIHTTGLSETVPATDDALRCIDLFAGAGGLSEGLSEAGFHSLFAAEIVPTYAKTYEYNHRGAQVTTADIRTLDATEIRKRLGIERGELDLIAGGPPCQGFSINAPVRSTLDQRNHLFKEYLRFVDAFQPRCILIENVPGLVSFEDGKTLHAILDALAELGYGADVRILGAAYYGVPQMRWRTIIIGTRGKELPTEAFPDPICHAPIEPNFTSTFDGHSLLKIPTPEKSSKFTTVKEAIGDLPPLRNGERGASIKDYPMPPQCDYQRRARRGSGGIYNHEAPRLAAINVERMAFIPPGGNWTDIPDNLLPRGMKAARKSDHTKRYGRVKPDGLASTILTKCDPHWGAYIHYNQDRSFTVREAARIQSFPDHYIFLGRMAEQFAQVGNAVPPMLAEAIGISIKSILTEAN